MVSGVLLSIVASQSAPAFIDVPLRETAAAGSAYSVEGRSFSQPADDLKAIKGYRLPKGVVATHSGTIRVANRQIAYYGVRDKKLFQFEEIGVDLNGNKIFDKSEIARYIDKNSRQKASAQFTFQHQAKQHIRLTAYRTTGLAVEPARFLQGSAQLGKTTIQFTITDSNMDGRFSGVDQITWMDRTVKSQSAGSLFPMPDGKYYTASILSTKSLRLSPDPKPTGTVSIKNGQIESAYIRVDGKAFSPSICDGAIVLPIGNYELWSISYRGKAADGTGYQLSFYCEKERLAKVEAAKDQCLDPGPISKVVLPVESAGDGFSFAMSAFCRNGDKMERVYLEDGSNLKLLPAPFVEILDPSGSKVSEIKLEYG